MVNKTGEFTYNGKQYFDTYICPSKVEDIMAKLIIQKENGKDVFLVRFIEGHRYYTQTEYDTIEQAEKAMFDCCNLKKKIALLN